MTETFKKLTAEIKAKIAEQGMKDAIAAIKESQDTGSFEVVISTADFDRQGESIDASGWDLEFYKLNPVVLWAHDYFSLPIGFAEAVEVKDGKLFARGRFAPGEANPFAQQVRKLYDLKIVRATSVGFIAKETEGNVIKKAELLEFSFVPVPANPFALSLSQVQQLGIDLPMLAMKGLKLEAKQDEEHHEGDPCTMPDGAEGEYHMQDGEMVCVPKKAKAEGDPCTMDDGSEGELKPDADGNLVCMPKETTKPEPEEEGDFIIIRVKDPDYFDPDSFRTIDISAEKGIKATVGCKKGEYEGGKCQIGTEVQRYLFDKEKWTTEDAQAWVDENAKALEGVNLEDAAALGKALEKKTERKDAEQIGAALTEMQSIIDNAIVEASRKVLEIVASEYEKAGAPAEAVKAFADRAKLFTAISLLKTGIAAFEGILKGSEGEEHADGRAPNSRSSPAGSDGDRKAFDDFQFGRAVLREAVTALTDALERYNEKAYERHQQRT